MNITPDQVVFWRWGFITVNATLVFTWVVMLLLVIVSGLVTRKLSTGMTMTRMQNLLEVVVTFLSKQISDLGRQDPAEFLSFIGTLFLFIATSSLLGVAPGFDSPTGSLSTTTALAICVLVAVPLYGISKHGLIGYLRGYTKPNWLMLPFNILGELSRTLALAVRLFGNMMSGTMIGGILLAVTPLIFPVIMHAFGLLTGLIQAYIFTILATVFITAATEVQSDTVSHDTHQDGGE